MTVYEETVELPRFLSPMRSLAHITAALVAVGYLYWSEVYHKNLDTHLLYSLIPVLIIAWDLLPVMMIINGAFFPDMLLKVDEGALVLKRGLVTKRLSLDTIVEVSVVAASHVKETTILQSLYQRADFLFLDRSSLTNIKILLSGWGTMYVATPRADEVAGILRREIARFQRESALRLIAAHQPKPL
jgi:hypothetical protein